MNHIIKIISFAVCTGVVCACWGGNEQVQATSMTRIMTLGVAKTGTSHKPAFTLNDKPFYPVVAGVHYSSITQELIQSKRQEGFNALQFYIDTCNAGKPDLREAFDICMREGMPVLAEVHEWEFWKYLQSKPDLNMIMRSGERVRHFPDYANPDALREHLSRYRKAAEALKEYAGRPVIAVSLGAYDAYHLPDGEVHADFKVPQPAENTTNLAYGPHALKMFNDFLRLGNSDRNSSRGRTMVDRLPGSRNEAGSDEAWRQWLLFRRHLVKCWLADTVKAVREITGLPITVTLDLNFALIEKFATPPAEWDDLLDFVIVYCYHSELSPRDYIPPLYRSIWTNYSSRRAPIVTLIEFSSALSGKSAGSAYAAASAPFSSGMIAAPPWTDKQHNQQRIDDFMGWINSHKDSLTTSEPERARILIIVDRSEICLGNPIPQPLADAGIACDIAYITEGQKPDGLNEYQFLLAPQWTWDHLPLSLREKVRILSPSSLSDILKSHDVDKAS
ncbi:MAG: hypothetical protein WCK47_04650 [bacterium]